MPWLLDTGRRSFAGVKLDTLRRLSQWADKIAVAARQLADELAAETAKAEEQHDPLGLHIYQSRAHYRHVEDADNSKSGRRVEIELRESHRRAVELGFSAGYQAWEFLMRAGAATPDETVPRGGSK